MEAISEGFLPHVHAKGTHFFPTSDQNYTYLNIQFGSQFFTFPGIYPETSVALDADFTLFDGFKNIHELDSANNSHEAAKVQLNYSLLQLGEQVKLKYFGALAAKLLSDSTDQKVKTLEDHLRIVQDQLKNGQATKYDVLQVQVELSEAKSEQIQDQDQVVLSRQILSQAMGLKNDDRPLSGSLPVLDADSVLKNVSEMDIKDGPELKEKQLQALSAEDRSAASQSFWFPKVSVIGEYQWYNSPDYLATGFSYTDTFHTAYFVGASASWDLLDGGLSVAKANEADERANEAKDAYEVAQLEAPYEFNRWKRKLISSMAVYKARLTDVDTSKENARLATLGFKAGTRTTNDVLKAEFDEYRASAELLNAQLDSLEALIQLEFVTGKRLSND